MTKKNVSQRWKMYCHPDMLTVKVIWCKSTSRYLGLLSKFICPSTIYGQDPAKKNFIDFVRAKDWWDYEKTHESAAYLNEVLAFIENGLLNKDDSN